MTVPLKPEAPIKDYLATFKFYDSKHRRLSIFGRVVPTDGGVNGGLKDMLEITVLTVSKEAEQRRKSADGEMSIEFVFDVFSKRAGRAKYESILNGTFNIGKRGKKYKKEPGQKFLVDIIDERPRLTFIKWANKRYYRLMKEVVTITRVKFIHGDDYVHPKKKNESKSEETA